MAGQLLIYGATGYTGRLICRLAVQRGERPILVGRGGRGLEALARETGCELRVADLRRDGELDAALSGARLVLNAAGPFTTTAAPLVDACLRAGRHYLDVAGELPVFRALAARSDEAQRRGVMLLPGVGFVVAASDGLAAHVAAQLPGAHSLAIGLSRPTLWSRGSLRTLVDLWSDRVEILRGGEIRSVPTGTLYRDFDYGSGPRASTAMRWPDVVTAHHSTGIPNIEVYCEVDGVDRLAAAATRRLAPLLEATPWRSWAKLPANLLSDGPSEATRAAHARVVVAEARDAAGRRVRARLRTPEPYTFTQRSAVEAAARVLAGDVKPGFQTPALAFGADWVLARRDVQLDVEGDVQADVQRDDGPEGARETPLRARSSA